MREMSTQIKHMLLRDISIISVMVILLILTTYIVHADSIGDIQLGKSYTGIISSGVEDTIEYYPDSNYKKYCDGGNETNDDYYYGYTPFTIVDAYAEYSLKVGSTGFYLLDNNDDMYLNQGSWIILDENSVQVPWFADSEIKNEEYTGYAKNYIFLNSGESYRFFVNKSNGEAYKFKLSYYGNEIERTDSWNENGKTYTLKYKITSDGKFIISGSGFIFDEMGSLFSGMSVADLIKTLQIEINVLWTAENNLGIVYMFPYLENLEFGTNVKYLSQGLFDGLEKLKNIKFHCIPPKVASIGEVTKVIGYDFSEWLSYPDDYTVSGDIFNGVKNAEAHYPAGCKAWNETVCKNYGGNINWISDSNLFIDVSPSYWFYDGVQYVNKNKIMTGVGNGAFSPNKAMSRAVLATVLYRIDGEKEIDNKVSFKDVSKNAYYTDAVAWAIANGIMTGKSDEKFAPNDNATRQEMTSAMYKYAEYLGKDVSNKADLSQFKDASILVSYGTDAKDAFAWAVGNGIVSGTSETQLSPNGNASRAQFAVIIKRFMENIK